MKLTIVYRTILTPLFAGLLAVSCTALHADDSRIAADSTRADTAAIRMPDSVTAKAKRTVRPKRARVHVDPAAHVEPVEVDEIADASNPACVQLVGAEHRLRIAKARYDEAMARFNRATQLVQERALDRDEIRMVNAMPAYPMVERQEYLQASMAVTALRGYCPEAR